MGSRRGTLANITNLQGRMSMLGPPTRTKPQEGGAVDGKPRASANGLPRPSIPRASIQNPRASIQNPRASLIPSSRPSLNQSGMRRLNMSASINAGQRKDPRPWQDKGFVVICQRRMSRFLSDSNYPYGLGPKSLSSPSNKEFYQMFQFLYQRLNPTYVFGQKPEDEVLPLLTAMNYPFKVAKNALITPGAPHVWLSLMGVLLWMVELLEYSNAIGSCKDDDFEGGEEEDEDIRQSKWLCKQFSESYGAWLKGNDEEFDRLNGDMINDYERRRQDIASKVDRLSQSIQELSGKIEKIENACSELDTLTRKKEDFLSDIHKFKKFAADLQVQKGAVAAAIAEMSATVEGEQREIKQQLKENQELQVIIDAQGITPADVERMMSAKNNLEESLQTLCQQRESIQKDVWAREVEVQKASDSLDQAISAFNTTAKNLRLVGPSAKYPKDIISDKFKCITLAPHASSTDKMVNCSIKQDITPCLQRLKEHLMKKSKALHDKYMDLHMEYEAIGETVDEQTETLRSLEAQLDKSVLTYKTSKLALAEASKRSNAEAENIRQEANKVRSDMATLRAQSESGVAGTGATVEENDRACTREREEMVQFITETLGALMEHKSNISDTLMALNQRLDEELAAAANL